MAQPSVQSPPQQQSPPPSPSSGSTSNCWPLYDMFLDIPHPAASKQCPGPFVIPAPAGAPNSLEATEIQSVLPQMARFAFPEYDEAPQAAPPAQAAEHHAPILNRHDVYATQNVSFLHFAFSLQLQSGQRLHGHVRRYLPPHLRARTRYDVGRRGERALVLLTRQVGADLLYAAALKSIEAISSQQAALSTIQMYPHKGKPQEWFLHQLSRHHQHLSQVYAQQPVSERGKPLIATIPGLELGDDEPHLSRYKDLDTDRFILPTSLLRSVPPSNSSSSSNGGAVPSPAQQTADGSIVPLLRCVGVAHAVRILSALLSERRVLMVSSSPTRLAVCSHAAVSMLAVGLLHWQHLYIPVLPPHLWQYLAAPYPYLIGILTQMVPRLDRTDGLGEVVIVHLDTNQLETRGMEASTILSRLPDLFRTGVDQIREQAGMAAAASASEMLAQELFELLKQDKKVLYGESTLGNVSETAVKATKAVKKTFNKLRDKGKQYLQQRTNSTGGDRSNSPEPEGAAPEDAPEVNSMAADYIYTEGCYNLIAEEEVRIAFTAFFLCMFGDMRWYLSTPPGSQAPVLDRKKFLQQKHKMGDGEGTPMWPLLNNLCQTQMLEEFVKARVEEVRARTPVTPDMPLFLQCAAYCRQHHLDFGILNIRRITRQVAEASPVRLTGMIQTNARRTAMSLTSNKPFEGDTARAIAQLVEQCRESTSVLFDVMSVIWLRIRDSRGLQWKHALQAFQILRNLLYHGPMAAISEATDGLSKIRAMKYYDNIRPSCAQQVRMAAATVYNLLVDRAKLFHIRRVCAERRRILKNNTQPRRTREAKSRIGVPFRNIHAMMHPNAARGTVVPLPPKAPTNETMSRGVGQPQQQPGPTPQAGVDLFGSSTGQAPAQQATTADDLAGLFGNVAVAPANAGATSSAGPPNPFDSFAGAPSSVGPAAPPAQPQQPQTGKPPPQTADQRNRAYSNQSAHSASSGGPTHAPQFQPGQYGAQPPPPQQQQQQQQYFAQPAQGQIQSGNFPVQPHGGGPPPQQQFAAQQQPGYGMIPQQQQGPPTGGYAPRPGQNQQPQAPQRPNANPFDPFG